MMFKLFALASVLTSAVLAQSSTPNPLIPTGISQSCNTFLTALNTDPTLNGCLTTLTNITSAFAPGASTPSSADISSTLTNLCANSATSACPQSLIRSQITAFFSACPTELTNNANQAVCTIYEVLYGLNPLLTSICSKDDSGNWCASGPDTTTRDFIEDSSFSIRNILAHLYIETGIRAITRRDELAIVPDMKTITQDNSQFLFFTPNLSESQLCVTCLRQVLTSYINFESNIPFAYNMSSSVLLGPQSALYTAVQSTCPANFLNGAVTAAGGLSGAAVRTYGAEYQRIIALVMGAVTLVISVAL